MKRFLVLALTLGLLVGCGAPPSPTPDAIATQVAQAQAVAGTLTALAPSPMPTAPVAPTSTSTPTPFPSPSPTETPLPLLTGHPMDYVPSEQEMPAGFVVDPSLSQPSPGVTYPSSAVAYSRGIFDMVAYVVVVAPDEASAKTAFRDLTRDSTLGTPSEVAVSGADEYASFDSTDVLMTKTFVRKHNVVAAIACGGEAASGADWYVSFLTRKLRS